MSVPGYWFLTKFKKTPMKKPLLAAFYDISHHKKVDAPLILGAAIFGFGWGIGGLCPGPALVNLVGKPTGPVSVGEDLFWKGLGFLTR